jgi:simple sugar transport system ATP-binding protein
VDTVLEVSDISKSFGPNRVLRGVSFAVPQGGIYGLMGANGAGKSTLIKILSGAQAPDGGRISLGGREVEFRDPIAAHRAGVGTVHQNPNDGVVLDMTVAENLALDTLTDGSSPRLFSRARTERHAREVAATLGLRLDRSVLRSPVRGLGVSERQLLVLARALSRRPEILILDEPTSALSAQESDRLFELIGSLVADGMTVLFVSHKLAEFDRLCDRVGVLRDGAMTGEFDRRAGAGFDWPAALTALFGRAPEQLGHEELPGGPEVLSLRGVRLFHDSAPFDLDVRRGQVTVLLGLLGSGKTELLEWVFGARPLSGGRRELGGAPFTPGHPGDAVRDGVYLLPESRHEQAIIPGWSVSAQMTLPFLARFATGPLMRARAERAAAASMMSELGVVARDPGSAIETLSGGNQQKVVIGRWLLGSPRVLLLDEPFRGVDINARLDIGATVREVAGTAGVLVATADLDEALAVGDRIVVLNRGELVADLARSAASRDRVIEAMSARPSTLLDPDAPLEPAVPAVPVPEGSITRGGSDDG